MSTKLVREEIDRFLKSSRAEVLCITGKWGVGKTYAWEQALKETAAATKIALSRYAYMSVFGQKDLDAVKTAVFETTVSSKTPAAQPDFTSMESTLHTVTQQSRGLLKFFGVLPKIGTFAPVLSSFAFLSVRDTIICFDDLERMSKGLELRDILGLTSFLREKRACKVVLLLNDEALSGDAGEEFKSQLEKVADTVVRFEPTPEESAKIAFGGSPHDEVLTGYSTKLGVVNVRVLLKMRRAAERLDLILSGIDPRLLRQSIQTVVLFTFAKFQPGLAPSLSFLEDFNAYEGLFDRNRAREEEEPAATWRRLLRDYDFGSRDDFDKELIEGVKRGTFDSNAVRSAAEVREAQLILEDHNTSFSRAWGNYHDSFEVNDDDVLDRLAVAFRASVPAISFVNADGTIRLFREVARNEEADALIEHYIQSKEGDRSFWNLRRSAFGGDIQDPAFREAIHGKFLSFAPPATPAATLIRIDRQSGWNEDDIEQLATLSADDFYAIFKELRGDDLRSAISASIRFEGLGGHDATMPGIATAALAALSRIAAESPINARRVRQKVGRNLLEVGAEADGSNDD